ncbi:MAG: hypothetical protein WBB21_14265, partial [Saprospiraceae bacterium]
MFPKLSLVSLSLFLVFKLIKNGFWLKENQRKVAVKIMNPINIHKSLFIKIIGCNGKERVFCSTTAQYRVKYCT